MSRLRYTDLEVRHGHRTTLSVDGEIRSGAWVAILGPNGAGKSTFLRCLAGTERHGGVVVVDDVRQGSVPIAEWASTVALVPQQPVVPEAMTVSEYVLLGRTAHIGWFRAEREHDRRRVAEVLDDLDLVDFAERRLDGLSGGELQRVTLARALATDARVLLLDEPTSALDLSHQIGVLELIDRVRRERGLTVVAAMHDLTLAGRFADRLLVLRDGVAAASGTVEDVLRGDVLSSAYGTEVVVLHDGALGHVVVPGAGRPHPSPESKGRP